MDAWRISFPRLTVSGDAIDPDLVTRVHHWTVPPVGCAMREIDRVIPAVFGQPTRFG
jgi:hypothetical protein